MFRAIQRREGMTAAISGMWKSWAMAVGFLTVLTILAPVVPRHWLAPINIVFYVILQVVHRDLRKRDFPSCSRLIQQVSAVILITAIVVVLISFFANEGVEITGQPYGDDSPFLVILITSPVATIVTLCYWLNRREPLVCRKCKMRYGNVVEHGFVGDLYMKEWRYQTGLLFWLSLSLTVTDWIYYTVHYVNTNLNRADQFFFIWLPLVIYLLSLVYLGWRYYSLWVYYCRNDEGHYVERPGATTLRFLVIHGDKLLLSFFPTDAFHSNGAKVKKFDTPVKVRTEYHERENLNEAILLFRKHTGISNADIKLAYGSPDAVTYQNIFHYFAFLQSGEEIADSNLEGEWFSWGNVMRLGQQSLLDRDLVAELSRIYDISMAWKTYDADGKRLYKIKHYHPTFHLRDIRNWNVDFNDYKWLHISRHNEDNMFYPLRRLFMRKARQKG